MDGRRSTVPPGIRLSRFLATRATRTVDLDVEFDRGDHRVGFRVVAVPGRDPTMTRLCTNLPAHAVLPGPGGATLSLSLADRVVLQGVEILREPPQVRYRESTHRRRTDLGESLRGDPQRFLAHAAQYVGRGAAVSTRRVAMCAWHILEALVRALLQGVGLRGALRRGLAYLLANARRANVPREHRTGRLRAGLELVVPA